MGVWVAGAGCMAGPDADDSNGSAGSTRDAVSISDADSEASTTSMQCTHPDTHALWAADGVLIPPMELSMTESLDVEVARSWSPHEGTLTLEFVTQCAGPLYLWALVWDAQGGNEPANADSFFVTLDDDPEVSWMYGCATEANTDERWWWLRVEQSLNRECDHQPLDVSLAAGSHTLQFRNREAGGGIDVAAIAGVVLSHDIYVDPEEFLSLEP